MPIRIADRNINRISIIDDQKDSREGFEFLVEDLGTEPVSEAGPLATLGECVNGVSQRADAAICDYNLRQKAYSTFNGAELAAELYKANFPALLCTKWHTAMIDEIRAFRRFIPWMIDPAGLDTSSIRLGIESCIREFEGNFLAVRRPWRALIRIEDVRENDQGTKYVYVVLPSWNPNEVVKLPSHIIPHDVLGGLRAGSRLHAKVNLGAVGNEELFFEDWEG